MIACKVTNIYHTVNRLVAMFHLCFKVAYFNQERSVSSSTTDIRLLDSTSMLYSRIVGEVISTEIKVLHALGYELQRLSNSPHKFLLRMLKFLKSSKEMTQLAWNFTNDAYLGLVCISYPCELLAVASIWLAYKVGQEPAPKEPWWVLSEYSLQAVEDCASSIWGISQGSSHKDPFKCEKMIQKMLSLANESSNLPRFHASFDQMYSTAQNVMNRFEGKRTSSRAGSPKRKRDRSSQNKHLGKRGNKRRSKSRDSSSGSESSESSRKSRDRKKSSRKTYTIFTDFQPQEEVLQQQHK